MPTFSHCLAPNCHNFHRNKKYCSTDCRLAALSTTPIKDLVLSNEEMIQSIKLYKDGIPVLTIAEKFKCGANTIYRHLEKSGVQLTYIHRGSPRPNVNKVELSQQEIDEIKFLYGFGFSAAHIVEQLKIGKHIILRVLRESHLTRKGFDPLRRIRTTDGHLVRSAAELQVDNWFYEHGIIHIYEPQLKVDLRYHADFFALGYYIELWGGGPDQKVYKRTMATKLALYEAHHLPLISLTWEDTLKNLDTLLAPLLPPSD